MKNYTFVLLTIFFVSSCRSVERKLICNEVTKYQVDETTSYLYHKGHCYSAPFDLNNWEILEDYKEVPVESCDGLQGVNVKFGIEEVTPKFTALQRLREESCRKRK